MDLSADRPTLFSPHLGEGDRQRLGEALRILLKRGSLLRDGSGQRELYDWCQLSPNREWLEDAASLLDLQVIWEHESRLLVAVPRAGELVRKLRLDESLVFLVLWYDLDTAVREQGLPDVQCEFTVAQLNDSLASKFGEEQQLSPTRLQQILTLGEQLQLVRVVAEPDFPRSRVTVLPTLRHVLPFPAIEEWSQHAEGYREMLLKGKRSAASDSTVNETNVNSDEPQN